MRIAVIMGGTSSERNVSIASGLAVSRALKKLGHDVVQVDSAGILNPSELAGYQIDPFPSDPLPEDGRTIKAVCRREVEEADVAFLTLHGGSGENGCIQGLLELMGIPYTGSGVMASALALNKDVSKTMFESIGIPTPRWVTVKAAAQLSEDVIDGVGGYPLIVKPLSEGSTVGLTLVESKRKLPEALELALSFSGAAIVEEYIPGREITAALLSGEVFPLVEIEPAGCLYDYESKYRPGGSDYIVPAPLGEEEERRIRKHAASAHRVLRCEGISRVDFRLAEDGKDYCLEVNTCPGMTSTSLVPMAARKSGLTFEDLVEKMLEHAISARR